MVLVELHVRTRVVVHFLNLPIILEKSHFAMEESGVDLIISTLESQFVKQSGGLMESHLACMMMNQSLAVMLTSLHQVYNNLAVFVV